MRDDDALDNNPNIARRELAELHDDLFGWSLSRCNFDRVMAEDLMQQAYVEVLTGRARFQGGSALKTFLFGVVQNLARSRFRRRTIRLRILKTVAGEQPTTAPMPATDDRSRDHVWAAVRALPDRQRDITELVFCRELTIQEASAVMGISVGSGRVHYDRAKKSLAVSLADLRDDEMIGAAE